VSEPTALKTRISLLENAVLGNRHVTDPVQNPIEPKFHINQSRRLETVSYLLKNGSNPKQAMANGSSLIDHVREKKKAAEVDKDSYWARVEALLLQPQEKRKRWPIFSKERKQR
jgi:hypothetical protein